MCPAPVPAYCAARCVAPAGREVTKAMKIDTDLLKLLHSEGQNEVAVRMADKLLKNM